MEMNQYMFQKYFPKVVELGSRFGRTIQSGINTAKRFSGWNRAVNNTVKED